MKILDPRDFPVTLYCNPHEKYITIHVFWAVLGPDLSPIRCRFFELPGDEPSWTSTRIIPQKCWELVTPHQPKSIAQWPTVACCAYDMTRFPDQEAKKVWLEGEGAPLIRLPPQQLHSHHAIGQNIEYSKASDSEESTAGDLDRRKVTLEHVDSILTSQRDEKLKVEQLCGSNYLALTHLTVKEWKSDELKFYDSCIPVCYSQQYIERRACTRAFKMYPFPSR